MPSLSPLHYICQSYLPQNKYKHVIPLHKIINRTPAVYGVKCKLLSRAWSLHILVLCPSAASSSALSLPQLPGIPPVPSLICFQDCRPPDTWLSLPGMSFGFESLAAASYLSRSNVPGLLRHLHTHAQPFLVGTSILYCFTEVK